MHTIRDIFNNKLFRIPDYQRGYSWEESHLEDFWQDLTNLQKNKVHYTGMISVEEVSKEEYKKWVEDIWLIEGRRDTPYFIVDGQQRLTSVIILIWVILNRIDDGDELSFENKNSIVEKYIYTENPRKDHKSFIFGYHKDNPSYEFLKQEIFEQQDILNSSDLEVTAYTNNLLNAKMFFVRKIRIMGKRELESLYSKVTKQLMFDFKILEKELDIFIVFETMNNRGKPLSNLEKLKNRLIYLSTLLKEDDNIKVNLREQINDSWKTVYKYLGLSPDKKLDDDSFLQNHWIMFSRYDRREPEFYANDIFDRVFTTVRAISGDLTSKDIAHYIESISEGAKVWFVMNNPSHKHAYDVIESHTLLKWLGKLNRIGFKAFAPLIMAAILVEKDSKILTDLIKSIESYVFLLFNISFRRSNTGTYHFNARASELYNRKIQLHSVIKDIKYWIYGDEEYKGYFDIENFRAYLSEFFQKEGALGYMNWKYLRYFLFEYEVSIAQEYDTKPIWNDYNVIQPICPHLPGKACWRVQFANFDEKQRRQLAGSLGNFLLTTKQLRTQDDLCFEDLRPSLLQGTANQREVANYATWDEYAIIHRGMKMLDFMEKRWNILLPNQDLRKKVLFVDFVT